MPQSISWQLSNFRLGLYSQPGEINESPFFASDMKNIRSDSQGRLTHRYPVRGIGSTLGTAVTVSGLGRARHGANLVMPYLLNAGVLKLKVIGGTDQSLVTDVTLTGKIHAEFVTKDVVVVTSEGTDQGYWLDLTNFDPPTTPTVTAYPFGIALPNVKSTVLADGGVTGSGNNTGLDDASLYYYFITHYWHFDPFRTMESIRSNYMSITTGAGTDDLTVDFTVLPASTVAATGASQMRIWRTEGNGIATTITGTATGGNVTELIDTGVTFTTAIIGEICLNITDKSQGIITDVFPNQNKVVCKDGFIGGTDNSFASSDTYRVIPTTGSFWLVDTLTIADTTYTDSLTDALLTATTNPTFDEAINIRNERIPSAGNMVAKHGDRLFTTNDQELRPSDVRGADRIWWAFRASDAFFFNEELTFCASYQDEMLLFGGPGGLWRMIGTSPFDYVFKRLADVGPVNPFAWAITESEEGTDLFAFVGVSGLYVSDGIEVRTVSEPLKGLFPSDNESVSMEVRAAAVVPFPNDEILFSIDLARSDGTKLFSFLRKPDGRWQKWEGLDILQGHIIEQTTVTTLLKSYDVYIIEDGEDEIREILWDNEGFDTDTTSTAGELPADIVWFWKKTGLDWKEDGFGDDVKRFSWLEINVDTDVDVTVTVWVDDTQVLSKTTTARAGTPKHGFRVLINRRGYSLDFQVAGNKAATIRNFKVVGYVL